MAELDPETQQKINAIIAEHEGISTEEPNPFDQERFLGGYSLGALVFSTFYYIAMKDKQFTYLSIPCALFFPPALLILPFSARRRAYTSRKWFNFNEFEKNQKFWDRAGLIGLIFMIIASYFILHYIYSLLGNLLGSNNISPDNLNQIQQNLQDTIGN